MSHSNHSKSGSKCERACFYAVWHGDACYGFWTVDTQHTLPSVSKTRSSVFKTLAGSTSVSKTLTSVPTTLTSVSKALTSVPKRFPSVVCKLNLAPRRQVDLVLKRGSRLDAQVSLSLPLSLSLSLSLSSTQTYHL